MRVYHQIPDHPDDMQKTATITTFVLFEFPYMAFDLQNASATFQRFMDEIFKHLYFCLAYLDDILEFSRSPQEYQHLHTFFTKLRSYGILTDPSKCVFSVPEI